VKDLQIGIFQFAAFLRLLLRNLNASRQAPGIITTDVRRRYVTVNHTRYVDMFFRQFYKSSPGNA
jgi:hypothetical protein